MTEDRSNAELIVADVLAELCPSRSFIFRTPLAMARRIIDCLDEVELMNLPPLPGDAAVTEDRAGVESSAPNAAPDIIEQAEKIAADVAALDRTAANYETLRAVKRALAGVGMLCDVAEGYMPVTLYRAVETQLDRVRESESRLRREIAALCDETEAAFEETPRLVPFVLVQHLRALLSKDGERS